MSLKNLVTPPRVDLGTVRLLAQRLNHYATQGPQHLVDNYPYSKRKYKCTLTFHIPLYPETMRALESKLKQSLYRPGQTLRVPEVWGSQISWQSAHEGGKVVSPTHRPSLPQEIFLVLISDRGRINPRDIFRPEELCQWKIPMAPSGIELAESFRVVTVNISNAVYSVCHLPTFR